jgi:ABC-2 type transport system permease protein
MILKAFYRSTNELQPITIEQVTTYVWLGQAFLGLLPWNVDRDIQGLIRSGAVSYELLRPLDLYNHWYSRVLALRTAPTLLRALPLLPVAALFFGMQAPDSWAAAGAFLLAMLGALVLSSAITNLLNITLMWTISGQGIVSLAPSVVLVFSGSLVPLPLFPEWAQMLLSILPFRGLVDTPFRLYLGHIPPGDVLLQFGHQLAWATGTIVVGRWVLSHGVRRLVVQGG